MALGKQAKVLSRAQIDGALGYIAKTRHPGRNRVIFLLSAKADLRAKRSAKEDRRFGVSQRPTLP